MIYEKQSMICDRIKPLTDNTAWSFGAWTKICHRHPENKETGWQRKWRRIAIKSFESIGSFIEISHFKGNNENQRQQQQTWSRLNFISSIFVHSLCRNDRNIWLTNMSRFVCIFPFFKCLHFACRNLASPALNPLEKHELNTKIEKSLFFPFRTIRTSFQWEEQRMCVSVGFWMEILIEKRSV